MRTTLSLDNDVAALLRRAQVRRKEPLKKIVNDALRHGLLHLMTPRKPTTPYRTSAVSLGRCLMRSLDDITEALAV